MTIIDTLVQASPDIFQEDRWSLVVLLDDPATVDPADNYDTFGVPTTERDAFIRYVFATFGGLPEELPEVVRIDPETNAVEVAGDTLEYVARLSHWITMHTIPRQVIITRNEER